MFIFATIVVIHFVFKNIEAEVWSKIRTHLVQAKAKIRNIYFSSRSSNT